MKITDVIEEFIKDLFDDEQEYIEIQRNELAEKFNCDLTMLKGGEHWFHTPQQLDILYGWIQNSFQTSQERFRTDRFL